MTLKTLGVALLSFALGAAFFSALTPVKSSSAVKPPDDRAADRAAIKAHIESICQAFIDWDVDKIFATHSEDWRGFLEGTRVPIKGIDEYMQVNGIDWPKDKGSKPSPNPERGFKLKDFDVNFYGPELAVACFNLDFDRKSGNERVTTNKLQIMDVYAKRAGNWIQVGSDTATHPEWRAEQSVTPRFINPQQRERILNARDAVWKAWFANDRATLEKLIPAEAIAIEGHREWSDRAAILAGARQFAESGARLVRLEFPKTELQVYGNTVVIYATYVYEIEANGQRSTKSGRGTEIFVNRNGTLVNTGWHLDDGD